MTYNLDLTDDEKKSLAILAAYILETVDEIDEMIAMGEWKDAKEEYWQSHKSSIQEQYEETSRILKKIGIWRTINE